MTYPGAQGPQWSDDDDAVEITDYAHLDRMGYWAKGGQMEFHPLINRAHQEGWTETADPDMALFKQDGQVSYGIQPSFMFDSTGADPRTLGWKGIVEADGTFWKNFDTVGDALDAFRDRNFRGFEPLYPDPSNDIDSDYMMVKEGFAIARGEITP